MSRLPFRRRFRDSRGPQIAQRSNTRPKAFNLSRDSALSIEYKEAGVAMKVLVAVDGSAHSKAAIAEVERRSWPADTQILVLTVVHAGIPLLPDPAMALAAAYVQQIQELHAQAPRLVDDACRQLRHSAPDLTVLTAIEEGVPRDVIVDTARAWNADLIVVGSHGHGRVRSVLLGSVALGVLTAAHCSVLGARAQRVGDDAEPNDAPPVATACQ